MTIATGGLAASGISKSFYGNRVLSNLELEIPSGAVHALLGHNGSGKSTFIKILAGYYTPDDDSGPIVVDGKELDPGNPEELGAQYGDLLRRFPHINVLGGCCGTDHRHLERISLACR